MNEDQPLSSHIMNIYIYRYKVCRKPSHVCYLELGPAGLNLLDVIGHGLDVTQLILVLLEHALGPLAAADHHIHRLQPGGDEDEKKHIVSLDGSNGCLAFCAKGLFLNPTAVFLNSLLQVNRGEHVGVVHLLHGDLELGAQGRG